MLPGVQRRTAQPSRSAKRRPRRDEGEGGQELPSLGVLQLRVVDDLRPARSHFMRIVGKSDPEDVGSTPPEPACVVRGRRVRRSMRFSDRAPFSCDRGEHAFAGVAGLATRAAAAARATNTPLRALLVLQCGQRQLRGRRTRLCGRCWSCNAASGSYGGGEHASAGVAGPATPVSGSGGSWEGSEHASAGVAGAATRAAAAATAPNALLALLVLQPPAAAATVAANTPLRALLVLQGGQRQLRPRRTRLCGRGWSCNPRQRQRR